MSKLPQGEEIFEEFSRKRVHKLDLDRSRASKRKTSERCPSTRRLTSNTVRLPKRRSHKEFHATQLNRNRNCSHQARLTERLQNQNEDHIAGDSIPGYREKHTPTGTPASSHRVATVRELKCAPVVILGNSATRNRKQVEQPTSRMTDLNTALKPKVQLERNTSTP